MFELDYDGAVRIVGKLKDKGQECTHKLSDMRICGACLDYAYCVVCASKNFTVRCWCNCDD